MNLSESRFSEFFKIDFIFLLFGLQLCPASRFEKFINWLLLTINTLNMISSLGLIFYSFSQNFFSPRSWILITQIVCNVVTQIHILVYRGDLQKLIEEILSNVPQRRKSTLNKLSWFLFFLFILLTFSDLIKVFGLWMFYGSVVFINNFFEMVVAIDGMNIVMMNFFMIKLFIDSAIAISWFVATLVLYIYLYWSLKYLNQALLGYINRVLTNEKAEDVTNTVYAFRKVYDMKKRFNSYLNLIPFVWFAEIFITINMLMYDAFVKEDNNELMCLAFNTVPVVIHSIGLVFFTITIVWLYRNDRDTIDKILRIICLESSRRERIAKLQAFLKEAEMFPTIRPDALSTFFISPGLLVKFLIIVINNLSFWFVITSHGRSIIGIKSQPEPANAF